MKEFLLGYFTRVYNLNEAARGAVCPVVLCNPIYWR